MIDTSWLADQFADLEARGNAIFKVTIPAQDPQVDGEFWGAKVVIKPALGRHIALAYVRADGKKLKRTIPLP